MCCAPSAESASVALEDKHPTEVLLGSLSSSALAGHTVSIGTAAISTVPPASHSSPATEDTTILSDANTGAAETAREPAVTKENGVAAASTSRAATSTTTESRETMSSESKENAVSASSAVDNPSVEPVPDGEAESTTTRGPERSKLLDGIRAAIKQMMSSAGSGFTRQLLQADISTECSIGVLQFMRGVQELEPWALRLVDATAKYPNGLLQATLADLGAFDECIETVVRDEYGGEKVRGQYCNVHISIGEDRSFVGELLPAFLLSHPRIENFTGYLMDERLPGLRLGLCFISSCSEQDLTNIGRALVGTVAKIKVSHCVTNKDEGINKIQAWIIGFLLYYTLNKQKENRFVVAVVAVIRRFIRATVPMFFMIMCMCLLPLIASGPNSKEFYERFFTEVRNHWWDLLFQLRNWRADQEVSTMPHLWYLSADYQFFLIAIVVIQLFRTRKWLVALIFTALSLASCAVAAWQIYGTHMTPFLIPVATTFSTVMDTLNYYYLLPFYHGVCFFSGCLTFLLVERYGKSKIPKVIQASLWCICLFCGLYCLFMKIEWYRSNERASEIKRLFYAFTDRIFWSICVAWFVFTCATGRGGIVNRFLSWNGFVPLSRLSFGVYLIHSPFYIVMYNISRERIFFSHFTLVSQCFSVFVWSYILSYFLFIACDAPTGHLEKLVFMRNRQKEATRGAAVNGVHHVGAGNDTKDLPVGVIEDGTIRNYFHGVVPPTLGGGQGAGCEGACRL
ncbi:hypothetical protein HPB48_007570 [Haemaphysalis longicornis]|uniref:Nose resistant-to-fluoxetine protein N-terminal domain-containing protein n=1 Tax=Haemaphysalis longicornis TaxID=44386 RepID=A0A9J6FE04_HAELO|nr:hypothetical protein HPB48_007570 [Haemaphysalis longicornis]